MNQRTTGTIISAKKQWWLKVNKKPIRTNGPMDGAAFPYVVKVKYTVDGAEYIKTKWIGAEYPVPSAGDTVQLVYEEGNPEKVKIGY